MKPHKYAAILATLIALTASTLEAQPAGMQTITVTGESGGPPPPPPMGFRTRYVFNQVLGPNIEPPNPIVFDVVEGSNAARAGLRDGDVILAINGGDTRIPSNFFPDRTPGTKYTLLVKRDDEELELEFIFPSPPAPQSSSGAQPLPR